MPGINQATVGDQYTAAAAILDVWTPNGGWFSVGSASVVVQLQYGANGSPQFSDEQVLGIGAFGTIPASATGIRFRNLTPGQAATVTAYIAQGGRPQPVDAQVWPEPALAISAIGSVSTTGRAPTRTIVLTPGASTYKPPANCVAILVEAVGAGGGGGGTRDVGNNTQGSAAGGGASGGYSSLIIAPPAASYAVTLGNGGAAGAAGAGVSGGAGGTGGDANFANLVIAKGGTGGNGSGVSGGIGLTAAGGNGVVAGAAGQVETPGNPGDYGWGTAAGPGNASMIGGIGAGAPGPYSAATQRVSTGGSSLAGNAGGPGAGGGGAANSGQAVGQPGGAGGIPFIVVTEFY